MDNSILIAVIIIIMASGFFFLGGYVLAITRADKVQEQQAADALEVIEALEAKILYLEDKRGEDARREDYYHS